MPVRAPARPRLPATLAPAVDDDVDPDFPDLDGVGLDSAVVSFPSARSLGILRSRLRATELAVPPEATLEVHDAELVDVDLTGRRVESLHRVVLRGCRLGGADLGDARLRDAVLEGCVLDLASLRGAELDGVTLRDCRTDELDLTGARLTDVTLEGVVLGADTLAGARLERVDLTGADLAAVVDVASLRGSLVSEVQAVALARRFARAAGVEVAPVPG